MNAIVFDLDGTLVHSAPDLHAAAVKMQGDFGLPPSSLGKVTSFIGSGVPALVERCLADAGADNVDFETALAGFRGYYMADPVTLSRPFSGVLACQQESRMSAISAIIFDVDGTLAETEELHRQAFNETFAEAGLDWYWSRNIYRQLLKTTGGKERMQAYQHSHKPTWPVIRRDRIAELHRKKTARYGELLNNGSLSLRPGIADLIKDAQGAGLRLAIATTTSRPNVDALCRSCWKTAPEEIFEVIAAGDEVPKKKPAPDVYLLALERLGLPANACVALEDSRNGVFSALEAGLTVHVVPSIYTAEEHFGDKATVWQRVPAMDEMIQPLMVS